MSFQIRGQGVSEVSGATEPAHVAYRTQLGAAWHGDAREVLAEIADESVNLVLTSPPFALVRQKSYGNAPEEEYLNKWFPSFVEHIRRVLREDGSLVLDLGGAWQPGQPTKSLYQYRLLLKLVDDYGFYLAQDFIWFNRAKLPGPRQWTTMDRVRVKDATNNIWWLSKTPYPKADNRKVLRPYSKAMLSLIKRKSYNKGRRPGEHFIGDNWAKDLGGAISPNVLETGVIAADNMLDFANTRSVEGYQDFCYQNSIDPHPARFPHAVVEFFIKFLTDEGDLILDPFAGSNTTAEKAEQLNRRWQAMEMECRYLAGSLGRFAEHIVVIEDKHLSELGLRWPEKTAPE